jgi:hypothetical protein
MKLYEFFGGPAYGSNKKDKKDPRDELAGRTSHDDEKMADDLYWYILDHDSLHKEHFLPLAREISQKMKNKSFDHEKYTKKWMPMVEKACMEFYKKNKMTRDPKDIFPLEMRQGLCQRLADQHHRDIESGEYKLG